MAAREAISAIVKRRFEASPEIVFDAWTKPDRLERWMFGPAVRKGEEIVHLSIDPRVGGAFSFLVQRGEVAVEHVGRYLEWERPRRLVFTWTTADAEVGSRVLIDIAPDGGGCELTLTQNLHPTWRISSNRRNRRGATCWTHSRARSRDSKLAGRGEDAKGFRERRGYARA